MGNGAASRGDFTPLVERECMIVAILLVIVVIWLFYIALVRHRAMHSPSEKGVENRMDQLRWMTSDLCKHAGYDTPSFTLRESRRNVSHTVIHHGKRIPDINLLMRDRAGRYYSEETVVIAFVHELAHVMTPGGEHGPLFVEKEKKLLDTAYTLGYLPHGATVDSLYPCHV